jgi:Holliday junction resolvase RusA-like endonuclease
MSVQRLVIQDWLPAQIANSHLNWREHRKRLKAAQVMAWASARQAGWVPLVGRARLTITLVFRTQRRRDTDNLYARVKGVVDGLKEWFVDDDTDHLELIVRSEVRRGQRATEITLEGIPQS